MADTGQVLRDLRGPPDDEPHGRGRPLTRLLRLLAIRNPLTLFHRHWSDIRRGGSHVSLKHLRYILGSLSAVMFSSAAAASV